MYHYKTRERSSSVSTDFKWLKHKSPVHIYHIYSFERRPRMSGAFEINFFKERRPRMSAPLNSVKTFRPSK
jgi:hypothetical protein